ncbi:MAG: adenosylmethionine decarboxylase [Sandaracinaceae bacterium]
MSSPPPWPAPELFEGPEKKLELAVAEGHPSLRAMGRDFWDRVVRSARAEILSERSNDHFNAYLLSESSLFVYDRSMTMITCGLTTLVDAVPVLQAAILPEALSLLVYERKNEHFPNAQHTGFFDDARRLATMVEGRALRFGLAHEHAVRIFHSTASHVPGPDDRTLEVLMHGIHPSATAAFDRNLTPAAITRELPRALEGFDLDLHVFEPAGFSLNAMRGPHYATLHVTPEPIGSYVSFETNAEFGHDPSGLVREVVGVFSPESFDVVAFEPDAAPVVVEMPDYVLRNHVQEPMSGYHVTFQHFYRPPTGPVRAFPLGL